ncbi:MAG TPA: type II toxin-antitoxin system RelE/ParE family toxin [Candidatus Acidoferrales bacterium]|nr:type II toxin-antitoxin system RelE/ParE family toxin [Candidatus Acidoferrales bacterium]
MKIEWTDPATHDLRATYDYWAEQESAAAADKTLDIILSAVEMLGRHPAAGRRGRVAGTRELVILGTPFLVAYRLHRGSVQVLAVLHGARKWPEHF